MKSVFMNTVFASLFVAVAGLVVVPATAGEFDDCVPVNAAGGPGYVNVRQWPNLNAPVIIRWNNPSHGSEWGSGYWCGDEQFDNEGRVWSFIEMRTTDGRYVAGWVSDKVLHFLDY